MRPELRLVSLVFLLPACLPDSLSNEDLHAKVLAASAANGGPGCGNSVIDNGLNGSGDYGEACDDGNTDSCDACDKCQIRTVLDVNGPKAVAGLTSMGPLLFDGKQSWSWETWFMLRTLPSQKPTTFLVVGKTGLQPTLAFSMGVTPQGIPICALTRTATELEVAQTPAIAVNQWHHLRCVWNVTTTKLGASLDGGAVQASTAGDKLLFKNGFDAASVLAFGQVPSGDKTWEPFDGELDEIRAALGPDGTTAKLERRFTVSTPGTIALYHMDPGGTDSGANVRTCHDATTNHLDADQMTIDGGVIKKQDVALKFAAEACYGFSPANAQCQANPKPPWCQ